MPSSNFCSKLVEFVDLCTCAPDQVFPYTISIVDNKGLCREGQNKFNS